MMNSNPNRLRFFSVASCCAALVSVGLAACGAVRMEADEWRGRIAATGRTGAIDQRALEGDLVGNSVLTYTIERDREGGGVDSWTLTLAGPPDVAGREMVRGRISSVPEEDEPVQSTVMYSRKFKGRLTISAGPGKEGGDDGRGEEEIPLLVDFLAQGFAAACAGAETREDPGVDREADARSVTEAFFCSQALIEMVSESSSGFGLVKQLIQYPSWWRWLVPTLDMDLHIDPSAAHGIETELGPAWVMPVQFLLKGDPAFYAKLTVVEPGGALVLGAGILSGEGFAPDRPERKVRWHLESVSVGSGSPPGQQ